MLCNTRVRSFTNRGNCVVFSYTDDGLAAREVCFHILSSGFSVYLTYCLSSCTSHFAFSFFYNNLKDV